MKKIGVVGAGTMGSQIGLVFADGSLETILYNRVIFCWNFRS